MPQMSNENNSERVDDIDRKILSLIQEDSRMTMAEIAKAIGKISKVAVSYRLKKLEDRKIIERYYAKLNPEKLDRGYLVISRAICSVKGKKEIAVSKRITQLPGVQSVYGIFGDYDLLLIARTVNKEEAKKLLDRVNEISRCNFIKHDCCTHGGQGKSFSGSLDSRIESLVNYLIFTVEQFKALFERTRSPFNACIRRRQAHVSDRMIFPFKSDRPPEIVTPNSFSIIALTTS